LEAHDDWANFNTERRDPVYGILGGWSVSGLLNYSSGTPLTRPGSRITPVFWNGGGIYANFNTPAGGFRQVFNPDSFDPNPANQSCVCNRFFDKNAFSDALPN
jgi:hypothetical protein